MKVNGIGQYKLLGETVDDAVGEAFDKTAKLLGLGYPGGPALSKLADEFSKSGKTSHFKLPRPMLNSGDFNFSFSGLKTAVLSLSNKHEITRQTQAEIAFAFQEAVVDILTKKSLAALIQTGFTQLVVAGGVSANRQLRENLSRCAKKMGVTVFYPNLEFCTDNGAMIALAGAMRLQESLGRNQPLVNSFTVRARWDLQTQETPPNK